MPADVPIIETHSHGLVGSKTQGVFSSGLQLIDTWRERTEYRRDLRRLLAVGPHMIEDTGISLEAARVEVLKPFWAE